jgi:hypothetical protein
MHWHVTNSPSTASEQLEMPTPAQPHRSRPLTPQTPAQPFSPTRLPRPGTVDPDSPLQERISSREAEPEVHPRFIEEVNRSMGFVEADDEYRNSLHTIPRVSILYTFTVSEQTLTRGQMGRGTPRGQMQTNIFQVGLLYAILKECRSITEALRALRAMTSDLHTRLEETFTLTVEHKVSYLFIS